MESDEGIYYTYRYVPFAIGVAMIIFSILACTSLTMSSRDERYLILFSIAIGFALMFLFFRHKHRFVRVVLADDAITIIPRRGDRFEIRWDDISAIGMPIIGPPLLYTLTLRYRKGVLLFNTGLALPLHRGGADNSSMGKLIKKKKHEFNI